MASELAEAACSEGGSAGRADRVAVSERASAAGISCRKGKTGGSGRRIGCLTFRIGHFVGRGRHFVGRDELLTRRERSSLGRSKAIGRQTYSRV